MKCDKKATLFLPALLAASARVETISPLPVIMERKKKDI